MTANAAPFKTDTPQRTTIPFGKTEHPLPAVQPCTKPKLLDQLRESLRSRHYSRRTEHAVCHTFRHSFATHLMEAGYDVTAVQALLGHNDPRTTMTYLHMAKPTLVSTISPLDTLQGNPHETSQESSTSTNRAKSG